MKCTTHPRTETNLRCGKCGKPICPKCLVQTPVGSRCRDCAGAYTLPTYRVSAGHYLLAGGVALLAAIVIGTVWGIIESFLPFRFLTLIVGGGIGYAIGEIVSRSVNRKRGTGLAIIGGLAVVISYIFTFVVYIVRFGFLPFSGFSYLFTIVAIIIGIYFAVNRLR